MFLTNNSPDLCCFLTLCIKIRQNNLYFASLPRISANLNENQGRYIFQALANISRNFRKIFGNIKFPENLQPYRLTSQLPGAVDITGVQWDVLIHQNVFCHNFCKTRWILNKFKFRNIAYVTVVLVTFKFQQIVRSWYSVQMTFVCNAL